MAKYYQGNAGSFIGTELPDVLLTPSWLLDHLGAPEIQLLDVRTLEHYRLSHIPGARHVELSELVCAIDNIPGMLLPPAEYAAIMSSLGISNRSIVIVYDDAWSMPAARVFWGLEAYGHRQVAVLNGGWDRWRAEDLPATARTPAPIHADFAPQPADENTATYAWLRDRLESSAVDGADIVLVDTRTPAEYSNGHIPGAICWDWMNAVPVSGWETVRGSADLRQDLTGMGITPDKEIVVYCRSGVRAAHTYLVLRHLGYPRVRNYDGSWLEWSSRTSQNGELPSL